MAAGVTSTWTDIGIGLVLLVIGAELLIRGSIGVARRFGVSELLIGLTLVGFGTSTPELVSSVQAALAGSPGIAIGNVVGSNIANILLILGLAAAFSPIAIARRGYLRDSLMLFASAIAVISVSKSGQFSREAGLWFLVVIALYITVAWANEREAPEVLDAEADAKARAGRLPVGAFAGLAVVGLVALIFGARFLVGGAIDLAANLGVSDTLIGLTVVAVGTSLPELVTSTIAAARGNSGLAYGNIVGSNIYNVFGILGVTSVIAPVPAPADIFVDNMVLMAATLALIVFAFTGRMLDRREGALFVLAYAAYIAYLVIGAR